MLTIDAYGDSITYGYPVTEAQNYINKIADYFGAVLKNNAVSSSMAADQVFKMGNKSGGDITTIMLGTNDTSIYGNGTNAAERRKNYINCLRTMAVCSSGVKITTAEKMTLTGTWNFNENSFSGGAWSSDNTATATTTVSGTAVYVCYDQFSTPSNNSVFEVWIDGSLVETVTLDSSKLVNTYLNKNLEAVTLRYGGLAAGSHTVLIKNKSSSPTNFQLNFVAGSAVNPSGLKKPVFFMNTAIKTTYTGTDSTANATAYCGALATMGSELKTDGLNVNVVDVNGAIISSDLYSDGVHWIASGHTKAYNLLLSSILANAYPATTVTPPVYPTGPFSITLPTPVSYTTASGTWNGSGGVSGPLTLS